MPDDLLNEFVSESREHLATIETDLLAIEEGGANLDEELVNKVFRAAHSIKGGSGFLGLNKVKELAHKAETVLDMLRSRKIIPNAEVTNLLLAAFDKLRELLDRPEASEQADTSELLAGLIALATSHLSEQKKASLNQEVPLTHKDAAQIIQIKQVDLDRASESGHSIYCVEYDLIHDVERKGLNLLQVFGELEQCGELLDCSINFEALGTLDQPIGKQLPLRLVLSTSLVSHLMPELMCVPAEKIKLLYDPITGETPALSQSAVEAAAPTPTGPPQASTASMPQDAPAAHFAPPPATESVPAAVSREALPSLGETPPLDPPSGKAAQTPPKPAATQNHEAAAAAAPANADETLRVNVGLLESLMNLAGELVLSRNQLSSAINQNDLQSVHTANQRLNQVTSDLQDAIMRTRLQPIGNVFQKFPRVVRDMAGKLGKSATVEIVGNDVALDRSIIEGLSDPLTHMVRNAVDHGIESPEIRQKAGKKASGVIRIEARHEAGQVVVEIADDGKGINSAKVLESALAKGLITPEKARSLSTQDKMKLIFLPGLSTAEKVTDISGRGVGMDVVKTNLDRLGGQIEIKSEPGRGSVFRIRLPLTLAIIPSLIVSVGKVRFAIPQINVEELLHLRPEETAKSIELVGSSEVLRMRDRVLPLLRAENMVAGMGEKSAEDHSARGALEIAVLTTGSTTYGLVVSSFHDTEEIVVKPLGRHLKSLGEYAGATILGDGTVALILDAGGLALKADLNAVAEAVEAAQQEENKRAAIEDSQSLLLFRNGPEEHFATPLNTVLRIERIKPAQVELRGGRRTMQYRGASLPLVSLSDAAPVQPIGDDADLAIIVSNVRGREVGLMGAMPVDVVETQARIDQVTHCQRGISGSAIIREKTTLIADLLGLVDAVYPEWTQEQIPLASSPRISNTAHAAQAANPVILLAEDSDFFRSQIKKYLEQDGLTVLEAEDGEAAWGILQDPENSRRICAVVTDIEMPRLTGLELTQRIRANERYSRLPIIALSSLASEEDIAKGKAAGVTEYQIKLDINCLIQSVRALTVANAASTESNLRTIHP